MAIKLVGSDDQTGNQELTSDYFSASKFTAVSTGSMTEFRVKAPVGTSGNAKFALYADNAGEPGVVINQVGSTALVAGWNTIAFPPSNIVSDVPYWLALRTEYTFLKWIVATGITRYKSGVAYPESFSDNPTGLTSATTFYLIAAGWGNLSINHIVFLSDYGVL